MAPNMTQMDFNQLRAAMVDDQIAGRGVRDPNVLEAMRAVPRHMFVPEPLREFAYEDSALQVDAEQTIPQPYLVALMAEALSIDDRAKVLEIGTGTGYATAVLSRLARTVCTVETSGTTAAKAASALMALGCTNVHVLHGDASQRFEHHAPFDAIMVNAPGPHVPQALGEQLAIGGRLVMSVGIDPAVRELVRVTRVSEGEFRTEDIADVRVGVFDAASRRASARRDGRSALGSPDSILAKAIAAGCERFDAMDSADLGPLLERIGDARVVLMGEATHGTSEFYRMREHISRELILRKNFNFIAIEGDWPDAARIDRYVRHGRHRPAKWTAFARFPVWMWRNREMRDFVDWLRDHNAGIDAADRVAFHGLDLYSLYNSIHSVVGYLEEVDPPTAGIARQRYGCLTPWQSDPASYGYAALNPRYRSCEQEVVSMLGDLLHRQRIYTGRDGERFLDAVQNARLVANAERYYRTMYYGSRASWNLRDSHMFETLNDLLSFHGPASKAIVWAHNSHVGDARATEMSRRGEHNIGQLCRQAFGSAACLIGFGTDSGTVAAASDWDGPMETKTIRPSLAGSYERLCHEAEVSNFILPLRGPASAALLDGLSQPRLERAIGVLYRPETELQSHYFQAVLPRQFDEYIWFDQTHAVKPLDTETIEGMPETYPFGL
ncbi:protein-L-isoaspartate O-methyltransferase [Variovorax sp. RA8]|uniref:protein-L-isoaspartate O-methyltransferase n=1 Tax=Variovorax sp. (strain JCM 16519 / RA8) TaxID=662548 RepID=UPI001316DFB5|nr:protein-L-isoaspartate O-methyltransferase [Variovorax sp. RA8]VTU21681.1 Protein-L-isoaspartate O-methyltransferase [Variovorax sp. RA8]